MNIPSWPQFDEREAELLHLVLESPQWGGFHPFVMQFEESFSRYQGGTEGISACNGTVTLEVALSALGIGPGDEVIVPAISFISTATSASRLGALPVFVDIEPFSFNIDPEQVRAAITPRTKAVIAVHFGGTMCRIDCLRQICGETGIHLIEDAAHAHGSEWNGRRAGSFGIAGSFSFQNGKVLCAGEGGMLVTSDAGFGDLARSLINQGRMKGRPFYEHYLLSTNFRMTGWQAALLIAQFERLDGQIETRTENARRLRNWCSGASAVEWQQEAPEVTRNSYYLLCGRIRGGRARRDGLVRRLVEAGIPCTPFYPHTLYQNPAYQNAGSCRILPCPNAEAYLEDAFWLPHRVLLSDPDTIDEIGSILAGESVA
jgi:3-amino-5-hydroxybenzoate synthase